MAKSKRELVQLWQKEAGEYGTLHLAYKNREDNGEKVIMVKRSDHYRSLADQAEAHAGQLDLSGK